MWWRRVGAPLGVWREVKRCLRETLLSTSALPHPACYFLPPASLTRQWKQSKDFNLLTLYFREKDMEKQVGWKEDSERSPSHCP